MRIAGEGPQPSKIVNSASGLTGPIAPGEWISIEGTQLGQPDGASYIVNASGSVDSTLAGVQVLFDTIPGTPVYVSDGLINAVAPYEISDRASTNISVIYQQAVANSATATIDGKSVTVLFAGASPGDLTGVFRLDIQTPAGMTADALPIAITVYGVSSPQGPNDSREPGIGQITRAPSGSLVFRASASPEFRHVFSGLKGRFAQFLS